jgi:dTDP-4-amino-4,6-dideoxygalactose transaminase
VRKIPYSKVVCDGNELAYVQEVLESGWLTTASRALEFERKFGEFVEAKFACAVNSCTSALHLALEAVGIGPLDKVIVPTWTFTASAEIIRYLGADPVIVDVDYGTGLLTPAILRHALDLHPEVKAVVVVHFGGQSAQMTTPNKRGILDLCRSRGVILIEDAAHAFPSRWEGRMIGSFGDVTCFSFYANKTITTGEGGMLTTNDENIFHRAKLMRLHGINRDIWNRFTTNGASWEYDVIAPGYKYNMPDINAAIGLAQLERAEALRQRRQESAMFYFEHLKDIPCIDLPTLTVPPDEHSWHLFSITLNETSAVQRNELIQLLADRGIGTSVHYKPLHRMSYYRERYSLRPEEFPQAEKLWRGCISLPIHPTLSCADLQYLIAILKELLDES